MCTNDYIVVFRGLSVMKDLMQVNGNETTAVVSVELFGDAVIEQFIKARNFPSANSAKTYRNVLRQLIKFFSVNQIAAPSKADIDAFVAGMIEQKKSKSTIRLHTTVIKIFFAWCERERIYRDVAADVRLTTTILRKAKTHSRRALTAAQAQNLLAAVTGDSIIARRDKAIIGLALTCGLRTVEISRADICDLRSDGVGGYYLDIQGKGHVDKDETVRVPAPVARLIDDYLSLRENVADTDPLFVSTSRNTAWKKNRYGVRLSEQSIGKMIARYMKVTGVYVKRVCCAHSARHFTATQALRNGVDIREVSALLRHSSLAVTAVYAHDLSVETRQAELSVAATLFGGAA